MSPAEIIILAAGVYAAIGVVFGAAFVTVGAARLDHAAIASPWSFRLLILPGAAALWPLLLFKWTRSTQHGQPDAAP